MDGVEWMKNTHFDRDEDELLRIGFWKPAPSFAGTITWSGMHASASVV